MTEINSYRDLFSIDPKSLSEETISSKLYSDAYESAQTKALVQAGLEIAAGFTGLGLVHSAIRTANANMPEIRQKLSASPTFQERFSALTSVMAEKAPLRASLGLALAIPATIAYPFVFRDWLNYASLPLPKYEKKN